MKQKTNDVLIWIMVAMIATSLVLQTFGMKNILQTQTLGEAYTGKSFTDKSYTEYKQKIFWDEILIAKFSQYKHVSDDGTTLNLFNDEQFGSLIGKRRDGIRESLAPDEILYIIEDSIDIYFTYDKVMFTGMYDDMTSNSAGTEPQLMTVRFPKNPENFVSFERYYDHIADQILRIIWYRLMVHDSGFMGVFDDGKIDNKTFEFKNVYKYPRIGWANYHYSMIINDYSNVDEYYKFRLNTEFYTYWTILRGNYIEEALNFDSISVNYPAITLSMGSYEVVMWDIYSLNAVKLFPTASLETRIREQLDMDF